jgi:hypothetical protein
MAMEIRTADPALQSALHSDPGKLLAGDDPKEKQIMDQIRSAAELLAGSDPDNGMPLVQLAVLEAWQSVRYENTLWGQELQGEVIDHVKAGRAAELLRDALARPYSAFARTPWRCCAICRRLAHGWRSTIPQC